MSAKKQTLLVYQGLARATEKGEVAGESGDIDARSLEFIILFVESLICVSSMRHINKILHLANEE